MSRIGKLPITVPAGVTVTVDEDNTVTVKGPKGTLTQAVNRDITLKQEGNVLTLERPSDAKPHKAMHGLYRSLVVRCNPFKSYWFHGVCSSLFFCMHIHSTC